MAASNLTLNPYQPTGIGDRTLSDDARGSGSQAWVDTNPMASWVVSAVRKRLLYRQITLSGFIDTTITWDARGAYEFIRVGDKKVVEKFCWVNATRFDFEICTAHGTISGKIEVDVIGLLFTRGFRLTLNDQLLYQE
jgi:hypothetical protein